MPGFRKDYLPRDFVRKSYSPADMRRRRKWKLIRRYALIIAAAVILGQILSVYWV